MLESLICNSCGAPLEVPDSANFVTCIHCKTSLKINRDGNSITTEAIEKLAETTEDLAEQVQKLTHQNELASLDRDWATRQNSFKRRDKHGNEHLPTTGAAWVAGVMVSVFGLFWIAFAVSILSSAPNEGPFALAKVAFPLFGIGFIAFGVFLAVSTHRRANDYAKAEQEYRRKRDSIKREPPE